MALGQDSSLIIHKSNRNRRPTTYAKAAAENTADGISKRLIPEASLAFISRSITEAKTNDTPAKSIKDHVRSECSSRGGRMREKLGGERKALAGHYYQFLSGRTAIGSRQDRVERVQVVQPR